MPIIDKIRSRSREEWQSLGKGQITTSRSWAKRNGEKALIVGILLGVAVIVALPLIKWLAFFGLVAAVLVWNISVPEKQRNVGEGKGPNVDSDKRTETVVVDEQGKTIYKE